MLQSILVKAAQLNVNWKKEEKTVVSELRANIKHRLVTK